MYYRVSDENVLERLVKGVANPEMAHFPKGPVQILFDHFQILLEIAAFNLTQLQMLDVHLGTLKQ